MPSDRGKTYKHCNYEAMIWTQKVMVRNRREGKATNQNTICFSMKKMDASTDWSDAQDPSSPISESDLPLFSSDSDFAEYLLVGGRTLLFVLFSSFLKSSDLLRFVHRRTTLLLYIIFF